MPNEILSFRANAAGGSALDPREHADSRIARAHPINRATTADLKTCLELEADRMLRCMQTEDHREAVSAFLSKRPPEFQGR